MAILFQEVKEEEIDVSSIVRVGSFEWKLVPAISRTTSTFIERLEGDRVCFWLPTSRVNWLLTESLGTLISTEAGEYR